MSDLENFSINSEEQLLKDMKKVVKYLKANSIALADCCGEDDEINAIPARKAYKRVKRIYKWLRWRFENVLYVNKEI